MNSVVIRMTNNVPGISSDRLVVLFAIEGLGPSITLIRIISTKASKPTGILI